MKTLAQERAGASSGLTLRQRQILKLLRAGKVNKEIATELGIGVGTVKQHVVAIFKRLNVRNRAMAASSGMGAVQDEGSATLAADGLLERRPCVVLSMVLPEETDASAVRRLHGTLAALAFDNDALFLARKGNAGDVIFGIQRVTEYDLIKALRTASAAFADLAVLEPSLADQLSGGLTAGLAVVSMKRYGGWSGEAIASSAIFAARELSQDAAPGQLVFGQGAHDLMVAFGIGGKEGIPDSLPFSKLDVLRWTGERLVFPLVSREEELGQMIAAFKTVNSGRGKLIYLEGETGMGKSRLCRELLDSCVAMGAEVRFFRCPPLASGDLLDEVTKANGLAVESVAKILLSIPEQLPELIIIDDFHLLAKEQRIMLYTAAVKSQAKGRLVVFSGRRYIEADKRVNIIHLGRLPMEAMERLVRGVILGGAGKVRTSGIKTICKLAAGVPLFAVELARHYGAGMLELPLLVIICARLDSLPLDRKVLRVVAQKQGDARLEEIATKLGEQVSQLLPAVERAMASGVLSRDEGNNLSFSHPLLSQAINHLSME